MSKPQTFSKEVINKMKKLMQTETRPAMQRKYQAVYLYMLGKTRIEIAEIIGRESHAVGKYLNAYFEKGLLGLETKPIPGRPRRLTPEQEAELVKVITEKTPHDVGFLHAYNWTANLAIQWVEQQFGVHYGNSSMLDIFHRLNLSHTRPTYTLEKADVEKQVAFKKERETLEKKW